MIKQCTQVLMHISLLVFISGCGGGSGALVTDPQDMDDGAVDPDEIPPGQDNQGNDDNQSDLDGTADFTVLDLTVANGPLNTVYAQATIANNGDTADSVPNGWFLASQESNFTDNYHHTAISISPIDNPTDGFLSPGQSARFNLSTAADTNNLDNLDLDLPLSGTTYGQLLLNPDTSIRYENPGNVVESYHAQQESNYDNNRSEIVTWQNDGFRDCPVDQYEQNDSAEQATVIQLDTLYEFNACDETYDVLAIDLTAGQPYVLEQTRITQVDDTDGAFIRWTVSVVTPEGNYELRDVQQGLVVPSTSGRHLIIAKTRELDSRLLLEVKTQ